MKSPFCTLFLASIPPWLHVGACVLLPLIWGLSTEFIFRWIARRRQGTPEPTQDRHFFIDYDI